MRKTIIAGNWKMYKTISQAIELANGLKRELYELEAAAIDIVLCPAFTALGEVSEVILNSNLQLGGQDVYWREEGAFTGEVSSLMLKDAGCTYVIIGHSERRQYFAETDQSVNKKIRPALVCGLIPIVCVGETLEEREASLTLKVLDGQVDKCLQGLSSDEVARLVIAYEPVWAIGTGKTASAAQAQEAHQHIRAILARMHSKELAGEIRIQYGGSVKPENINELMQQPDIDGALVGGASLNVDSFSSIVKKANGVKK
jgi:triosephosphate isomerase